MRRRRNVLPLVPWVALTIVLGVLAPWTWLPVAIVGVWVAAAIWSLWHAPHDGVRF